MTIWYAQKSDDVNAVNVFNDAQDGSGSWLDFALLDVTDVLQANSFTIQLNVDTTCAEVNTFDNGGGFILHPGATLTANVKAGTTTCVQRDDVGDASYVVGGVVAGTATSSHGVNISSGTVIITGNALAGSGTNANGVLISSGGAATVVGHVTGGSGSSTYGVRNDSLNTVNITGSVTGGTGSGAHGTYLHTIGVINVTGDVVGAISLGALNNATGTINISGNATGGATIGAHGCTNVSTGSIFIGGSAIGGSHAIAYAAVNSRNGTITVAGDIQDNIGVAIYNSYLDNLIGNFIFDGAGDQAYDQFYYTEDIVFEFDAANVFGGTCPIEPASITGASKATPVNISVVRPKE
jgi:hypothetical protein